MDLSACHVLVVGATGVTGAAVVHRLLALPVARRPALVRLLSRGADARQLRERFGPGDPSLDVIRGDVASATTMRSAMRGITHVFYCVGPPLTPGSVARFVAQLDSAKDAYVTGLRHCLRLGRPWKSLRATPGGVSPASSGGGRLRQVVLLSARNCDQPFLPSSVALNTIAGWSQLYHVRQERMLRREARRRLRQHGADTALSFGYVVLRPPKLVPSSGPAERVGLCPGGQGSYFRGLTVSRAAVCELMVHALGLSGSGGGGASDDGAPRCLTFEVWSEGRSLAPALHDEGHDAYWIGAMHRLPSDDLPAPDDHEDEEDDEGSGPPQQQQERDGLRRRQQRRRRSGSHGGTAGAGGAGGGGGSRIAPPSKDWQHAAAVLAANAVLVLVAVATALRFLF